MRVRSYKGSKSSAASHVANCTADELLAELQHRSHHYPALFSLF
jgi:hypothetical protein